MNRIFIFLFFILTLSASAQIDTCEIKITGTNFHSYTFQGRQCYPDDGSQVSDSIIIDVKEVSYPIFHVTDHSLEKFLNDTIQKISGVYGLSNSSYTITPSPDCIQDKPGKYTADYRIHLINSYYLSLTLSTDEYACCGAKGSNHKAQALTFDLHKKKLLRLKDVVKKRFNRNGDIVIELELNITNRYLRDKYKGTGKPSLFYFSTLLNSPIAIETDKVIIYWPVSWESNYSDEKIDITFDKHSDIFKKKFIKKSQRNT